MTYRTLRDPIVRVLGSLIVLAVALTAAHARDVQPNEMAALETRIADFENAIRANDFEGTIAVVPPPMLEAIAQTANVSVDQLKAAIAEQMASMQGSIEFESFGMALDEATEAELPDGNPYLLIPTQSVINIPDVGTMTSDTHTLAFQDAGEWYLVRIEDQNQIDILRQVYPGFADVEFPESNTSMAVE